MAGYIQQTSEDGTLGMGLAAELPLFRVKRVAEVIDGNTLRFEDPFRYSYDAS